MANFNSWLSSVQGQKIGDGQCVALVDSWAEALNPGVEPFGGLSSVVGAKDLAGTNNSEFSWVANDHNNPNQVPSQGDIMVFGATPAAGYTNTFNNPYGHTGVCDSANSSGYTLVQQNAPESGEDVNVTTYPWKFRPCLGWLTPAGSTPSPTPTPPPAQAQTITLPATTGPWHLYKPGGPYNPSNASDVLGVLVPSEFGGLTYTILATLPNGVYRIHSQDYGVGDLWTKGSDVVVS